MNTARADTGLSPGGESRSWPRALARQAASTPLFPDVENGPSSSSPHR
jgi:hypothetical protein